MRPFVFAPAVVAIAATLLAQNSVPRTNKVSDDSVSAPCTVDVPLFTVPISL